MFHVLKSGVTRGARRTALAAVLAALYACFGVVAGGAGAQTQADIAVIVHPEVAVDNLTLADLRRILTGDREFWPNGPRVTIFMRAPVARERDVAVRDVCQMTEAQFRQHWIAKVFRAETPSGPKIVYSNESAIDQVSRAPGGIGLVQWPVTARNVKVLKIEGRLPGQAGYRLR